MVVASKNPRNNEYQSNDGYTRRRIFSEFGVETDDEILNFIRNTAETAYHPIGTCRMGQGPECVVDERSKVHGRDFV